MYYSDSDVYILNSWKKTCMADLLISLAVPTIGNTYTLMFYGFWNAAMMTSWKAFRRSHSSLKHILKKHSHKKYFRIGHLENTSPDDFVIFQPRDKY